MVKNILTGWLVRFAGSLGYLPKINLLSQSQLEQALERAGFSLLDISMFSESNTEYTLKSEKCLIINI